MENQRHTIAIADDEVLIVSMLEQMAKDRGFDIVGTACNGLEAVELVRVKKPEILVLDLEMPLMDGLQALRHIVPMNTTAVVVLTAIQDPRIAREAMDLGASGYMEKPLSLSLFKPMLETAFHRFLNTRDLHNQISTLSDNLETRKLLEKAKGILMEQQGFSEPVAHQVIQKMSQDQGISLKDVCRSVIQVKMILGKPVLKRNAA